MPINTLDDFKRAYADAIYWWEPQDRPVIWACTDQYPGHTVDEEVFAKVSLVNRLYRANLHMGGRGAEWQVAKKLVSRNFDATLAPLRAVQQFNRASLPKILDVHEEVVKLVREVTDRCEISFAAKYLSFHFPTVVPVFDSKAYATAWKLVGRRLPVGLYANQWNCDFGYHCEAILLLIEELPEDDVEHRLKRIDSVLYDSSW